jgi:hypothetical protein
MRTRISTFLVVLALVLAAAGCERRESSVPGVDAGIRVEEIDLGRSLNADRSVDGDTESFRPQDTIYASVATEGTAEGATLTARWTYQDGQTVDESSQTISPTGPARTGFQISRPSGWPEGEYKLEVMLNGTLAGTKEFEVTG